MSNSQTRRSVSVKGITYQRLKNYAEQEVRSVSGITEEIVNQKLDELGVRTFTQEEAEALRPKNTGEPPLKHPDHRANEGVQEVKKDRQQAKTDQKAEKDAAADAAEGAERRAENTATAKAPSDSLTPSTAAKLRGGGVHSF